MTYNLPGVISGDTFNGVQFEIIVNSAALDLTGSSISMDVYNNNKIFLSFSLGKGLTIIDAVNGKFNLNQQVIYLSPNIYTYRIKFSLQNGTVYTYIEGNWIITT